MSKVQVQYKVPVTVWVDLESCEIERVLLEGDNIELDFNDLKFDPYPVFDEDWDYVKDQDTIEKAIFICDTTDWPAWD